VKSFFRIIQILLLLNGRTDTPIDSAALAKQFGVHERTVYRYIQQARRIQEWLTDNRISIRQK